MFVQDVGGLAGRRRRRLGQKLRLRHGHVEVKGPVFQPLLLPVDLRDVLPGTRHLCKTAGKEERMTSAVTQGHLTPEQESSLKNQEATLKNQEANLKTKRETTKPGSKPQN